jgi:hypothetical protein
MLSKKPEELASDPVFLMLMGMVALHFLTSEQRRPEWLKDCAPVHARRAGAWRGKGSFGHGFGPQAKHR